MKDSCGSENWFLKARFGWTNDRWKIVTLEAGRQVKIMEVENGYGENEGNVEIEN